jgi:hypothetical protein
MEPREARVGSPVSSQRRENKLPEMMAARVLEAKNQIVIISGHLTFTHDACDWSNNRSGEMHHIEEPGCLSDWGKCNDEEI